MSTRATVRALPAMLRIGFAEGVAYRAEFLVWVLSTTMPLIMLALWTAVARDAPMGRFGQREFTLYFLMTFVVRQLVGSWVSWQMNWEIRQGTLSQRLLRPVHPIVAFGVENVAMLPLRVLVSIPVVAIALLAADGASLPRAAAAWGLALSALVGAWLISFCASFAIGCLAFHFDSSLRVMEVWLTLFFVFSGYLAPIELFPHPLRVAADWLPFRYQLALPVELLTSAHAPDAALALLARQWTWAAAMLVAALVLWRTGLKRFAAFGG